MIPNFTPSVSEVDRLTRETRDILAKGMRHSGNAHNLNRNLTVNAIPGNGGNANLVVITLAGTPTVAAVCICLTHENDLISRHITTGRNLTTEEVKVLRNFVCHVAGQSNYRLIPGTFAWESGFRLFNGTQMHPGTQAHHGTQASLCDS